MMRGKVAKLSGTRYATIFPHIRHFLTEQLWSCECEDSLIRFNFMNYSSTPLLITHSESVSVMPSFPGYNVGVSASDSRSVIVSGDVSAASLPPSASDVTVPLALDQLCTPTPRDIYRENLTILI